MVERTPVVIPEVAVCPFSDPYGYIYITTNTVNNMKYIGQHVCEFRNGRMLLPSEDYYLGSGKKLLKAKSEYGTRVFVKRVVDWASSRKELNEKELFWMDFVDAVESDMWYNTLRCSNSGNHSKEWKEQLSKMYKGRKFSDKTRALMSKHHHDISGKNNPWYGKDRHGKNNPCYGNPRIDKWVGVVQLTLDGEYIAQYSSIKQASEANPGCSRCGISSCICGNLQTHHGYKWVKLQDYTK